MLAEMIQSSGRLMRREEVTGGTGPWENEGEMCPRKHVTVLMGVTERREGRKMAQPQSGVRSAAEDEGALPAGFCSCCCERE